MSILLEHPEAQALLERTALEPASLRRTAEHLTRFLHRYLPHFYRTEQRTHAEVLLRGKFAALDRKTTEPIATDAGLQRRPLQHFVGAGCWDDDVVLAELQRHVRQEIGHADAVLVLDASAFAKKGTASCGVARQWSGRLGKVDNCQVGVFLGYAAPGGHALLAARLYLPAERANDRAHRVLTQVPDAVVFAEKWRLGLDLLDTAGAAVPHGWLVADDEFGRASAFRQELRSRRQRYVVDVPCNTLIRDLEDPLPPSQPGGRPQLRPFERVDHWASRQPRGRWRTVRLRHGEKGPHRVRALTVRVQTKDADGHVGGSERLVVYRERGPGRKRGYALSNVRGNAVPLRRLVEVRFERPRVEAMFGEGKSEVGLGQYEVRSWVGWHHHMTLSLLALWFLQVESRRLKKNVPG